MGVKENIKALKEEISTEEQFLESVIKTERFFKHKKPYILGAIVVVLLGIGAYGTHYAMEQATLKRSNAAYALWLKNPQDSSARDVLKKENPKLYDMIMLQEALAQKNVEALGELAKSKDAIVSDIASYHHAQNSENVSPKSDLFKGFALLQEGYSLLKENKISEAKLIFAQIESTSPLKQIAQNLEHYQGLK